MPKGWGVVLGAGATIMVALLAAGCRKSVAAECSWPAAGALSTDLLQDIALAEDVAIRHADSLGYRGGWRDERRRCEAILFSAIAADRSISLEDVASARARLDVRGFDWLVNLPMLVFTIAAARLIGLRASRRFAYEPAVRTVAVVASIVVLGMLVVGIGHLWAGGVEVLRLGSGHLSYRAARIPWAHHRVLTFVLAIAIGVSVALLAPAPRTEAPTPRHS